MTVQKSSEALRRQQLKEQSEAIAALTVLGIGVSGGLLALSRYSNQEKGLSEEEKADYLYGPDTKLSDLDIICAHNAYTETDFLGNQELGITDLFNQTPTRGVQLDVVKIDGEFYIQHELHGYVKPVKLEDALKEINTWLEQHPDQVILIDIDVLDPSLRYDPELAEIFHRLLGDKLNRVPGAKTIEDLTNSGCQLLIRENNFGAGFYDCQFHEFDEVYAHNDSLGYFLSRGFEILDETTFEFSDNYRHTLTSEDLKTVDGVSRLNQVDMLNDQSFDETLGSKTHPTLGPIRIYSDTLKSLTATFEAGGISSSIAGSVAVSYLKSRVLLNRIKKLQENESALTEADKKEILNRILKTGLSYTSTTTNALSSLSHMYPGLMDSIHTLAFTSICLGAVCTGSLAAYAHHQMEQLPDNKDLPNQTSYYDAGLIDPDTTSSLKSLERSTDALDTITTLFRFSGLVKQALPASASVLSGVSLALTTAKCASDAIEHAKLIHSFMQTPSKAIHHYKKENLTKKAWGLLGDSILTEYLSDQIKHSNQNIPFDKLGIDANKIKTGSELYKALAIPPEKFIDQQFELFIRKLPPQEIHNIRQKLNIQTTLKSRDYLTLDQSVLQKRIDRDIKSILGEFRSISEQYNKVVLNHTPLHTQTYIDAKLKFENAWQVIDLAHQDQGYGRETFSSALKQIEINRTDFIHQSISKAETLYEQKALEEYIKLRHIPKIFSKALDTYKALSPEKRERLNFKDWFKAFLKSDHREKISQATPEKREKLDHALDLNLSRVDQIDQDSLVWKTKKLMGKDIFRHGVGNTLQISANLMGLAIAHPEASGPISSTAVGGSILGISLSKVISVFVSEAWEKETKYRAHVREKIKDAMALTKPYLNQGHHNHMFCQTSAEKLKALNKAFHYLQRFKTESKDPIKTKIPQDQLDEISQLLAHHEAVISELTVDITHELKVDKHSKKLKNTLTTGEVIRSYQTLQGLAQNESHLNQSILEHGNRLLIVNHLKHLLAFHGAHRHKDYEKFQMKFKILDFIGRNTSPDSQEPLNLFKAIKSVLIPEKEALGSRQKRRLKIIKERNNNPGSPLKVHPVKPSPTL